MTNEESRSGGETNQIMGGGVSATVFLSFYLYQENSVVSIVKN